MIVAFFPLKKLRRNSKYLLFAAIVLVGVVAVYHEMAAAKAWSSDTSMNPNADGSSWRRAVLDDRVRRDHQPNPVEDSVNWRSSFTPQTWKAEYKGQANLHVFEDWCGSCTADLYKNLHYPLYPHSRTTVQKLAISPQWTNYGLRIFGYLHPYADGEFVFALSSDDNSELWLSTDDSPLNLHILAWVGKTGTEWTAPGEFEKYASQISKPVWLSAQRRYFFEVIHKQNDRGTDHVEVAWQLLDQGFSFQVIESNHISLYVNESALLMSDVAHIPQTTASHQHTPTKQQNVAADMLRDDPRDTLYQLPLINSKFLQDVLPDCSYKPSYTIKDFPLLRYQGLQFVHMSYIHPKDYTRLTHMETESSCFYPESPYYMKMFGFSRYMRLDRPDMQGKGNTGRDFGFKRRKSMLDEEDVFDNEAYQREKEARPDQVDNALFPDYGDDYDDYAQRRRRKLFSLVMQETNNMLKNSSDTRLHINELQPHTEELQRRQGKDSVPQPQPEPQKQAEPLQSTQVSKHHPPLQQNLIEMKPESQVKKAEQIKPKGRLRPAKRQMPKSVKADLRPVDREQLKAKERPAVLSEQLNSKQHNIQRSRGINHTQIQRHKDSKRHSLERDTALLEKPAVAKQWRFVIGELEPATTKRSATPKRDTSRPVGRLNQRDRDTSKDFRDEEIRMKMPRQGLGNSIYREKLSAKGKMDKKQSDMKEVEDQAREDDKVHYRRESARDSLWGPGVDFEGADDEDFTPAPVFDTEVNWSQTFQISHLDLQAHRSDWIELRCNISGNLLLHSSDALPLVNAFMDQLNEKHHGRFTLSRVVNIVKRMDGVQGSRYLLELELKDVNGQLLRLSYYIYTLIRHSRQRSSFQRPKPQLVLCNPVGFRWNPVATVHFIVPVKNQARWVQQLIVDMEQLFRKTRDANFELIIADFNSTDMDVRKALQKSSLPRYQYVKLSGNFERSAGLQAGVDLINDDHSIVFLCDLHIHFPPSIIDSIRKHCVEGYMAFAPIVLRLDCGATPLDARGYWEVNGFGLLGIYKSDLDAVGGMNTREFTDRWGGEDWELLDRILQAGLEVERIYLRNFFHHYHSKRGMWNRQVRSSHS
ncbi:beta-1,4-N-acetylgalactosaminyltransferase 3 [Etheostoma spectabile]|uniref:beta-1,4-N-acetylgalactosaminyltransferase 3 n=1 Tax=Etheostoma spectabile TaxID=54343 RepID=UPI0013AF39EB|nr:beta-1,4-N-acetylgalactosaminyltransferase 3-like [Etheostoma spectabile]